MKQPIIIKARAKINLGLNVLGRRPDNYHNIESVMQQISLADTLFFEPSPIKGWRFFCTDPQLSGKDNLVCRAAVMLEELAEKPLDGVNITLYKNIPVEAGLAGGSSDAAAALQGLNKYWNLGLSETDLFTIGARLGSDVPFCLQGGTALAGGRGEVLEKLPDLPFSWVIIAIPDGLKISTAAAYAALDQSLFGKPLLKPLVEAIKAGNKKEIYRWLEGDAVNIFETAELPGSNLRSRLKMRLRSDGLNPVLSGSGPAMFMLTADYSLLRSAAYAIREESGKAYLCWTTD